MTLRFVAAIPLHRKDLRCFSNRFMNSEDDAKSPGNPLVSTLMGVLGNVALSRSSSWMAYGLEPRPKLKYPDVSESPKQSIRRGGIPLMS